MTSQVDSSTDLNLTKSDQQILDKVKQELINDGQRWSVPPEEKLVYLWRKKERTEVAMKKLIEDHNTLKKQRKSEFTELEKYVQTIKSLSESKDKHTRQLENENRSLTTEMQQLQKERQAYLKEHQAVTDLMQTEGLTDVSNMTLTKSVQHLLQEKTEYQTRVHVLEKSFEVLADENQELRLQSERFQSQLKKKTEEAASYAQQQTKQQQKHQTQLDNKQSLLKEKEDIARTMFLQYEEANTRAEKLDKELTTERQALQELEATNADMVRELKTLRDIQQQETVESLNLELQATQQMNQSLKAEIDALSSQLELKSTELSSSVKEQHSQQRRLKELDSALTESKTATENLLSQVSSLQTEKALFRKKLDSIEDEKATALADCENSIALKEADLQKALEHTTVLTAELKQATLYQEQLAEENDKLRDQLQVSTSTQSRETLEAATLTEELKKELTREQEKTATLQAETLSKRAELGKEMQAMKDEVDCLKQQIETKDIESSQQQQQLEKEREKHTVDTNEYKQELSQLQEQLKEQQTITEELSEEKSSLEKEFEKKVSHSVEKVKKVQEAVVVKESQVQELQEQVESLQQKLVEQSSRVIDLVEENETKYQSSISLQQQLEELSTANVTKEETLQQLMQEQQTLVEAKDESEQLSASMQLEMSTLKKEHEATLRQLETVSEGFEKVKNEAAAESQKSSDQIKALKISNKDLKAKLDSVKDKRKEMVTKMEEEKSKMVQKIAELEAEIRKKQQMAAALQKKSGEEKSELETSIARLTEEHHSLDEQLHQTEESLEQTRQELQSTVLQLQQTQSFLSASQEREDDLRKKQKAAVTEEQSKVQNLQKQLEAAQKHCEQITREANDTKQRVTANENKMKEQNVLHQNSVKLLEQRKLECDGLAAELSEMQSRWQEDLRMKEDQLKQVEAKLVEERKKRVLIEDECRRLTEQNEQKESVIHEQQQHLLTRTTQETETKALQIELKECRQQLTNQAHAKDGAEMKMSTLLGETDAIKQQLERSNTEMTTLEAAITALKTRQSQLEDALHSKHVELDARTKELNSQIKERKRFNKEVNKLKIDKEALEREMDELRRQTISSQETCKTLAEKLKHRRKKQLEKSQRSQDELVSAKDQHHSEREHLMSRMETIHRELRSAQMKLTHEQQLRDKANDVHKQLLEEKRHLARKLQNAEQEARENSLNYLEAQAIIRRLKHENELLDKSNEHLIQQNSENSSMLRLVASPLNRSLEHSYHGSLLHKDSIASARMSQTM